VPLEDRVDQILGVLVVRFVSSGASEQARRDHGCWLVMPHAPISRVTIRDDLVASTDEQIRLFDHVRRIGSDKNEQLTRLRPAQRCGVVEAAYAAP